MTTHTLPQNTLSPQRPTLAKYPGLSRADRKVIFSRAPREMGYGRPAQSSAGQP